MELFILIAILFVISLAFSAKDKPSDLPPFTEEDAKMYYQINFSRRHDEDPRRSS
jgi:hypothetical protein